MDELLIALEAAVTAGDRQRALELEQAILQQLAAEAAEHADTERRARALMSALRPRAPAMLPQGAPGPSPAPLPTRIEVEPFQYAKHHAAWVTNVNVLDLERGSDEETAPVIYPVWFGTNRRPHPAGGFDGARADHISCGRVDVHVPEAHRFGETGSGFWTRLRRGDLRDDHLRVQRVAPLSRADCLSELQRSMQAARDAGEAPHALFFLHGYSTSFEEAAIRAAQIGVDLKVPGATAFFSWPSRGSVTAYTIDEASIEASEAAISEFLLDFSANCGAERVHVIAHSMGNRGLLRALQRIAANAETRGKLKFGQIFLAAPDVDRDLFLDLARLYPEHSERTTLYASGADLPVHLSSRVHDAPRAGYFMPYTVAPGIDTVAVPDFNVDLLGHSYFAQADALLHDIYDLMRHGQPPAKRQRVEAAAHEELKFWRLRR